MKKYSVGLVFSAVILAAALFFLVSEFKPINSLMKPPKVEGENLAIQLAFEKNVGDNYLLKQPIKGDYRSAYTFIDLDGDGDDEVIVFYSGQDAIDIVRMNVLDVIDGEWQSVADFESLHNQIQEVEFADLNGDKLKEIIVGWTTYQDDYSKLLSIYKISLKGDGVSIRPVFDDTYSHFEILDIDSDGKKDILSLKRVSVANTPEAEYRASCLSYTSNGIAETASIPLDLSIASVTSVTSDFNKETSLCRIYIDGYKIDSGMATDCLYWNKNSNCFEKITYGGVSLASITARGSGVFCSDINSDGFIEIPIEEFLPASSVISAERSNDAGHQSLIKWVQIGDGVLNTAEYRIINSVFSYSFAFDSNWIGHITVENDISNGVMTFCELKNENGQLVCGSPYFSVKAVTDENNISYFSTDYDYLMRNKGQYYYCRIFDKGEEFGITYKKIKNSMIMG